MTGGVACFLLREEILSVLEGLHHMLPDASLREDGEEKPAAQRFVEIIKEALRWETHSRDWYLHGRPTGGEIPSVLKMANQDGVSYLDGRAYLEELGQRYSWCLIPWGVYGTGLMMALIAPEDALFTRIMKYLYVADLNLLVSTYTMKQLRDKQFRGAIFRCSGDSRIRALWQYGRVSSETVLVLSVDRLDAVSTPPSKVELLAEAHGYQFGPVCRRWVRISDERVLAEYVSNRAIIVTASGLDEKVAWLALQDFAGVADRVNRDRLSFGLKALESVPWVYIPRHDDERWEIYVNRDPQITEHLLSSETLTGSPDFTHRFFC